MRDLLAVAVFAALCVGCSKERPLDESPPASASHQAEPDPLPRYAALMDEVAESPPLILGDMSQTIGRDADTCHRSKNLTMDLCFWFLNREQSMKVFTTSLAADGVAGADPKRVIQGIYFVRDDRLEKEFDGKAAQMAKEIMR